MPRIGLETAARMKDTMKVWRPKLSFLVTFPQAEIGLPSAPTKRGPEVEAEDLCGNTETAAPVSTRNFCCETESWRKMRPPRALSCPRRRPSFPPSHRASWSSRGSTQRRTHTSCVTSKFLAICASRCGAAGRLVPASAAAIRRPGAAIGRLCTAGGRSGADRHCCQRICNRGD